MQLWPVVVDVERVLRAVRVDEHVLTNLGVPPMPLAPPLLVGHQVVPVGHNYVGNSYGLCSYGLCSYGLRS